MKNLNLNLTLLLFLSVFLNVGCEPDDDLDQEIVEVISDPDEFTPFLGTYDNIEVHSTTIIIRDSLMEEHSTFTKEDDLVISRKYESIEITSFWTKSYEAIVLDDFYLLDVSLDVLRSGPFSLKENENLYYDLQMEGEEITITRNYNYGRDGISETQIDVLTERKK